MSDAPRRRSGGRAGNTRGNRGAIEQMPWRIVENTDRPIEPLTEEGIQAIHEGAMTILEDIGIEFLNTEALAIFKDAGCKVEDEKVFLDRHWVMKMIGQAPSEFTITPRNPAHELTVGAINYCLAMSLHHRIIGIWNWAERCRAPGRNAKIFSGSANISTAFIL